MTPEGLWRGARPDAEGAAVLIERGVRTVVNLEWLHDDRNSYDDARVPGDRRYEIGYFRVRDWEPFAALAPGMLDDNVAHFLAVTRTQPAPVYVHCRSGQNRTGVMVAAYRVFNGMGIEEAIAEMERYHGAWFKYDAAYIRSLAPERRAAIERRVAEWIPKLRRAALIVCADSKCAPVAE